MSNKLQAKDLISLGLFTVLYLSSAAVSQSPSGLCQFSFPSWGRYGH